MLEAMFNASVGDDVFGDDPTVRALEEKAATMFRMEAAVFCPSGTMTNQIAIKAHTKPGDEVICDATAHIYLFEGGGMGLNSGCSVRTISGNRGRYTAADAEININDPHNIHLPFTRLVSVENTSNKGGGSCWDFGELVKIAEICRNHRLAFHLDGARLFNALCVTGESPAQYGALFDSISICLSKGLGAPVGSLLLGRRDFIAAARRYRKAFGGAMRQSGYLAAAGIYALDHHIERLQEDHRRAKELGDILGKTNFVSHVMPVETNIVIFDIAPEFKAGEILKQLQSHNVHMAAFGPSTLRAVTHLDFDDEDLEHVRKVAGVL
jgi:threonine aldolase